MVPAPSTATVLPSRSPATRTACVAVESGSTIAASVMLIGSGTG